VGQLHHLVHPGRRARVQQARRRADGPPPAAPRPSVLTRGLIAWLAFTGLLTGAGTLGVISWADHAHGLAIARTMGMVTFALFSLFFSIESKDERDSAFSLDTFSDKTFLITTSGSFVLLILSTVLSIFHTVLKTVQLDVRQWLICTAVALSIVVAAEIRKAMLRQTPVKAIPPAGATAPEPLGSDV
jgi:Ca2+-transporting ATPase